MKRSGLAAGSYWTQTYQSRFGKSPWLKPYTDDVLEALAKKGVKRVYVMLPGFTADCLETLDEIGHESRELFLHAGGERLHNGRCLNDHPRHGSRRWPGSSATKPPAGCDRQRNAAGSTNAGHSHPR